MKTKFFYDTYRGEDYYIYTLENEHLTVGITDFGAAIQFIKVGGVDIALGFNSIEERVASGTFAGGTIGRVGNRIKAGDFTLNGRKYHVTCNEGGNHLHGGVEGFDKKLFDICGRTADSLTFDYKSPDGEEGYPGSLYMTVTYTLKGNTLRIDYTAISDKDTLFNPTNHTYFALNGEGNGDCRSIELKLNADYYTPADSELIPTGEITSVENTPFDFRSAKLIGRDFGSKELIATNGYDHNFMANGELIATARGVNSGITMSVYSDMPCFQLYTGGAIKPCKGKSRQYGAWSGFCIEPQYCPNAINLKNFDKPIIYGDKRYEHYIKYTWGISG